MYRYESGLTRVPTSRLIAISSVLGVSIEVLTNADGAATRVPLPVTGEVGRLLWAFSNINRPEQRKALLALARSMAEPEGEESP
jgi:hypothetical protein